MSDRLELFEVGAETEDGWEHMCFCVDEASAEIMSELLSAAMNVNTALTTKLEKVLGDWDTLSFPIRHREIVADVDLNIRDY